MRVYNKRTDKIPSDSIYVGRPSRWGNPFVICVDTLSQRQAAVDYFRGYALDRLQREPDWLKPLRGKDLVCWCTPKLCHADILLDLANKTEGEKC